MMASSENSSSVTSVDVDITIYDSDDADDGYDLTSSEQRQNNDSTTTTTASSTTTHDVDDDVPVFVNDIQWYKYVISFLKDQIKHLENKHSDVMKSNDVINNLIVDINLLKSKLVLARIRAPDSPDCPDRFEGCKKCGSEDCFDGDGGVDGNERTSSGYDITWNGAYKCYGKYVLNWKKRKKKKSAKKKKKTDSSEKEIDDEISEESCFYRDTESDEKAEENGNKIVKKEITNINKNKKRKNRWRQTSKLKKRKKLVKKKDSLPHNTFVDKQYKSSIIQDKGSLVITNQLGLSDSVTKPGEVGRSSTNSLGVNGATAKSVEDSGGRLAVANRPVTTRPMSFGIGIGLGAGARARGGVGRGKGSRNRENYSSGTTTLADDEREEEVRPPTARLGLFAIPTQKPTV